MGVVYESVSPLLWLLNIWIGHLRAFLTLKRSYSVEFDLVLLGRVSIKFDVDHGRLSLTLLELVLIKNELHVPQQLLVIIPVWRFPAPVTKVGRVARLVIFCQGLPLVPDIGIQLDRILLLVRVFGNNR